MNQKIEKFGITWDAIQVGESGIGWQYKSKYLGEFFTTNGFEETSTDSQLDYKIVSLINEASLKKQKILLVSEHTGKEGYSEYSGFHAVTVEQLLQTFPRTLSEKQIRILQNLYRLNGRPGSSIEGFHFLPQECFAVDDPEAGYLLDRMKSRGLISVRINWNSDDSFRASLPLKIEENGWVYLEDWTRSDASKTVFVAMWFSDEMNNAFAAMERAINDLGLRAFRIDKKEHNNEISGEILYEIQHCRFLVADVTRQRQGVYFEAGYAMALGMPVIWTCRKDDLENVHFDTRQYNHVVWNDEQELEEKLRNRIKGTIFTRMDSHQDRQ